MTGRERWKNRKKRRLPAALAAIILLAAIAAVLAWAHNDRYGQYRKKDFELKRDTGYSKGVPLEDMNFDSYRKFMPAMAPVGFSPEAVKLRLPCDVRYYTHREDAEPALTLKKGTEVYAVAVREGIGYIREGYGTASWPSYEKGWRYAQPFQATGEYRDDSLYFVRLSELEKVSGAFLAMIRRGGFGGYAQLELPENVWAQTRYTDMALYDKGVFCSEDLERMVLW